MDGEGRRVWQRSKEKSVNYSNVGKSRRAERRQRKHFKTFRNEEDRCRTQTTTNSTPAKSRSTANRNEDIPGYVYDPIKNRYFKVNSEYPKMCVTKKHTETHPRKQKLEVVKSKCPSRLLYFRRRELSSPHGSVILKRKGLEDWAKQLEEKKSFSLNDGHPCPAFEATLSCVALSASGEKMLTVNKLCGMNCSTVHVLDVSYGKDAFIVPKMLATVVLQEITHIEWNPNKDMENFFLLNILGSEESTGSTIVGKFDERSQSFESRGYPLPYGTAWHCSWCRNPLYAHLIGTGGSKQAVLVDWKAKTSLCKIRTSSDVFCVEFSHKSPQVYLGCRNGDMMCVDVRMKIKEQKKPFNISTTQHSSVTFMKVMHDDNYLMASSLNGMIKMWDIRLSKPVKEYNGNINETKLIPFVMDSSQSIIASAGQDGKTRIWSVGSGELLNIINHPLARNDNSTIPLLCLGESWGNQRGNMAFGLGINDNLHIYC